MLGKILVPYAGSPSAQSAWNWSLELARKFDAELHLLAVVDATLITTPLEAEVERRHLLQALQKLRELPACDGLRIFEDVTQGEVSEQIVAEAAKQAVDLIVMGRPHASETPLIQQVVDRSPCAVLVVR